MIPANFEETVAEMVNIRQCHKGRWARGLLCGVLALWRVSYRKEGQLMDATYSNLSSAVGMGSVAPDPTQKGRADHTPLVSLDAHGSTHFVSGMLT